MRREQGAAKEAAMQGMDEALWREIGIDPAWWRHTAMGRFLVRCDAVAWLRRDEIEGGSILFCMAAHEEVGEGIPRIGEDVIVWPIGPADWEREVTRRCTKLASAHQVVAVAQPAQRLDTDSPAEALEWMRRRWRPNGQGEAQAATRTNVRKAFTQIEALRATAQPCIDAPQTPEGAPRYENEDALHERAWGLVNEFSLRQTQWQPVQRWEDPQEPLLCADSYRIQIRRGETTIEIEGPTECGTTQRTKVRARAGAAGEYRTLALEPGWGRDARWLAERLGV